MRSSPRTLAARYVFPVEGPPVADGLVAVDQGRLVYVGPARGRRADLDLGNVAILPGFVNAHTHLDLAPIERAPGSGPEDEIAWLGRVIAQRRGGTPEGVRATITRNLAASVLAGTTALADTTT